MRNRPTRFDNISIALHWLVALSYFGLFGLGAYMVTLGYYDPLYTRLPYWHKGLGILLIFVVLFRLLWHMIRARPEPGQGHQRYERVGAGIVSWGMTIGLLIVLMSGYMITTSAGATIDVLTLFKVPAINFGMENQEDLAGQIHWTVSYLVLTLAIIHTIAALKHHFIDRDDTLKRILPGARPGNLPLADKQ